MMHRLFWIIYTTFDRLYGMCTTRMLYIVGSFVASAMIYLEQLTVNTLVAYRFSGFISLHPRDNLYIPQYIFHNALIFLNLLPNVYKFLKCFIQGIQHRRLLPLCQIFKYYASPNTTSKYASSRKWSLYRSSCLCSANLIWVVIVSQIPWLISTAIVRMRFHRGSVATSHFGLDEAAVTLYYLNWYKARTIAVVDLGSTTPRPVLWVNGRTQSLVQVRNKMPLSIALIFRHLRWMWH